MLNGDYAFVAFKEADYNGEWRLRINGLQTPGAVFEPAMIRNQARSASAQGKPYFVWGWNMEPSTGDARKVEFRVHLEGGKPSSVEMVLQMRKFDQSPDEEKSVSFPWPEE